MHMITDEAFTFQERNRHHILNIRTSDELQIRGFLVSWWKSAIFFLFSVPAFLLPWFIVIWSKKFRLRALYKRCPLYKAAWILLTDSQGRCSVRKVVVEEEDLNYPEEYIIPFLEKSTKDIVPTNELNAPLLPKDDKYGFVRYFLHHKVKYMWKPSEGIFERLSGIDVETKCVDFYKLYSSGIGKTDRIARLKVHGRNLIDVSVRSYVSFSISELINPFYLFEVFSVAVWLVDEYTYYAVCILVVLIISLVTSVYERRMQNVRLQEMAVSDVEGSVTVLNKEEGHTEIPTSELVPGDILVLPKGGWTIPCDAVVLQGNCIVNECMLTGEESPKTKTPLPYINDEYCNDTHQRHTIYSGTEILQTRFYGCNDAHAIVVRTGFNTIKGELIRAILHPKSVDFKFYRDSLRFLLIMGLVALSGAVYCVYLFTAIGAETEEVVIRALDILTIVIPPAMPAAVSAGTLYAMRRLERQNVHSIAPGRINMAGKVNIVCFDKTGTLTEGSIEMRGVIPARNGSFTRILKHPKRLKLEDPLLVALASCHSLTRIDGQLMGDPLDLKMFQSTGWEFEEPGLEEGRFDMFTPPIVRPPKFLPERSKVMDSESETESDLADLPNVVFHSSSYPEYGAKRATESSPEKLVPSDVEVFIDYEVGIIRQFPFSSSLQRTSVIVRTLGKRYMDLFCKGSPEKIHLICREETVPEKFHDLLRAYTARGYRVLALSHKQLHSKVTWKTVQRIQREQVESDMNFIGLLIMHNTLKKETIPVVRQLRNANIRTLMVTGDNLLTSLSVARDCGMIPPAYQVIQVSVQPPEDGSPAKLTFNYAESPSSLPRLEELEKDAVDLREEYPLSDISLSYSSSSSDDSEWSRPRSQSPPPHEEAIRFIPRLRQPSPPPGNLKKWKDYFKLPLKMEDKYRLRTTDYSFVLDGRTWEMVKRYFPELVSRLVTRGLVFARMMPDQKTQLITELQELGYIVAMCGDGANDCGALKMAHVGISLSDAESSVAAPFTSKVQNISCIPIVIKEGRCALVTSFGSFKYMALYSMVQFISVMLLYPRRATFSDFMFLYMDLFVTTIFAIVMGYTEPETKIVRERPQGSITGLGNVLSIASQIGVAFLGQKLGLYILSLQPWYVPVDAEGPDPVVTCWETTVIFCLSIFQYISLACAFSYGKPFRKPFYTNRLFMISLLSLASFSTVLTLYPIGPIADFFELVRLNGSVIDVSDSPNSDTDGSDNYGPFEIFRLLIFSLVLAHLAIAFFIEYITTNKYIVKKFRSSFIGKSPPKNRFKIIEDEMEISTDWPPIGSPIQSTVLDMEQ
ncbi:polyamine-transporting ATPase 13A2-like [Artemia franciscana]|uniref:Cation-transporting ATPase n=1 Tax=Artemia franciscana TaxID=6661 RepID=A0AA88L000_ARTSF|nr:hypothetical protein QYM36_012463 [Artemia franciscana]